VGPPKTFTDPSQRLAELDVTGASNTSFNVQALFAQSSVFRTFDASTQQFGPPTTDSVPAGTFLSRTVRADANVDLTVWLTPDGVLHGQAVTVLGTPGPTVQITNDKVALFEIAGGAGTPVTITYRTASGQLYKVEYLYANSPTYAASFSTPAQVSPAGTNVGAFSVAAFGNNVFASFFDTGDKSIFARRWTFNAPVTDPAHELSPAAASVPSLAVGANRLYAVWNEGPPTSGVIEFSFSTDGGATWTTKQQLSPAGQNASLGTPFMDSAGTLFVPDTVLNGGTFGVDALVLPVAGTLSTFTISPPTAQRVLDVFGGADSRGDVDIAFRRVVSANPVAFSGEVVIGDSSPPVVHLSSKGGRLFGQCSLDRQDTGTGEVDFVGGTGKRALDGPAAALKTKIGVLRFTMSCGAAKVLPILVNDAGKKLFARYKNLKVFVRLAVADPAKNAKEVQVQTNLTRPK
jgi:hypothetical protein